MSEAGIRINESKSFGNTNMIAHQGMANIFYQAIKLLRILGAVKKFRKITSGCY